MATKVGGIAAALGGTLWGVAAWYAAFSPPYGTNGNVGNPFLTEDAWLLAALPLIAVGALTVDSRQAGRAPTMARVGAALLVLGAVVASLSLALEAVGAFVMQRPLFEIGSRVLLIPLGGLLLGAGSLKARVVPAPAAATLLVGAALLFIANSENWMAGLAAVFGLGWLAVGATLIAAPSDVRATA